VATPVAQPSTSNQSAHSSQNFDGIGFGKLGSLVDPASIRAITEQLVHEAKRLKESGVLGDLAQRIG